MKDLGEANRILGMDITRDRRKGSIWLSQQSYVEKLLKKFQMDESRRVSVPIGQQFKLSVDQKPKNASERKEMEKIPCASIVGSVMYTMVCTRPDITHAVSVVSRYMADPGRDHWFALKWILRYMRGSADFGILFKAGYGKDKEPQMGFCDSDYAVNCDNRKSQSGYIFNLFGSAVSWKSNLQSVVALSTTEAEYIAMTEAVKKSFWLKGILGDFGIRQEAVTIKCDSSSAICLSKHQTFYERSKHINVRLHFIRDEVSKGKVKIEKVSTDDNAANMLTKALPTSKFNYCMELVNLTRK